MPTKSINHGILRRFPVDRIRPVINYYQPMQITDLIQKAPKVLGITLGDLTSFKNDTSIHHISERQAEKAIASVIDRVKEVGHGLDFAKRIVPSPPAIPSGPKILGVVGQLHGVGFHPNQHMVNEGLEVAKKVEHVIGRFFHF